MSQSDSPNDTPAAVSKWPASSESPSEHPDVLVLFHGLLAFAHNTDEGVCEVAVNNEAKDHVFHFRLLEFDKGADRPKELYSLKSSDLKHIMVGPILLDAVRPTVSGVRYFQVDGFQSGEIDLRPTYDWRRLPDFESKCFYDQVLDRNPNSHSPRMYIRNGLFHTCVPTDYAFYLTSAETGELVCNLGQISFVTGASICLEENGYVTLKIGKEDFRLRKDANKRYVIVLLNICETQFEEVGEDETGIERPPDFPEHYKTFKLPREKHELTLKRKEPRIGSPNTPYSDFIREILFGESFFSDQRAPCGSVGFGLSDGFWVAPN